MAVTTSPGIAAFSFGLKQGADTTISMTWLQDDGVTPVNLTGYAMKLAIRAFASSSIALITLTSIATSGSRITLGGTAGTVSLIFAHADTATLVAQGSPVQNPFGNGIQLYSLGVYDLQFTDPTGSVGYLLEGSVTLDPQVTI